MARVEHI